MRAMDVMTRDVRVCRADEPLSAVALEMWHYEIHSMPVVDEKSRPVAVVTDRSVCMAALRTGRPLEVLRAERAMMAVVTVAVDTPVERLRRQLRDLDLRWAPVVGLGGVLAGVVTIGDIERSLRARPVLKRRLVA